MEARKLIAAIATMDHPHALELANILGLAPPPSPAPPPEPTMIAAPPAPEPPAPPPIFDDLAIDPMELAVFRAAEASASYRHRYAPCSRASSATSPRSD